MRQCREKLTLLDTTFFCCLPEEHQCAHGYRFLQSDVERFAARAERAETDLAAARALLGEVREWIPYYRWIPDLRERVDAIIGKKTP